MCCGKSFIGFGFDIQMKADITLDALTSLLPFPLYSVVATYSCLRLQEGDVWQRLGKISVCL